MTLAHFKSHFQSITDTRQTAKVTYPLLDLLFATLCSVMTGGNGWLDIHDYVEANLEWFQRHNLFLKGVPVDDTFARIIATIKPAEFQQCFINWMQSMHQLTSGELVAIDGKTLRGSYNREDRRSTIHMVSAYTSANKLVLGQLKTEEKSNEITAIPELIKLLDLRGALVSIDAMGCQTKIAKRIVDQGGDYLLAVKGNQETLEKALEAAFKEQRNTQLEPTLPIERGHGRVEVRRSVVLRAEALEGDFSHWKGLKTIALVERFRVAKQKVEQHYSYYISSKELTAEQLLDAARAHWGIESMHWVLDVTMNEDECQIYRDNGAENLATVRHLAQNILRAEKESKMSIARKQRRCAMKTDYLEQVLMAGFKQMLKN
jgi:predicted transposase YbfD/YdcC